MSVGKVCGAAYPLQLCKILREVLRRYAAKAPAACRPFVLSPKYRRKEREGFLLLLLFTSGISLMKKHERSFALRDAQQSIGDRKRFIRLGYTETEKRRHGALNVSEQHSETDRGEVSSRPVYYCGAYQLSILLSGRIFLAHNC